MPRVYDRSQSLAWNLTHWRLQARDLLGFPPDTGRSLDLYRRLIVLDR